VRLMRDFPVSEGHIMIIFQRIVTFDGPPEEVTPWALEITEAVNKRTHLNVSLWQGLFGGPAGTLAWSALVDNLTTLEAATDSLVADASYLGLVSKASDWTSAPAEDFLLRMIHASGGDYVRPAVGGYAETTAAVPANGQLAKAGAWGVDIADFHSKLTHSSVLFCTSEYGAYGEMRWLALYDSAAAVDSAAEMIAKDSDYAAKLAAAEDLFVAGLARRTLARRIA
jgi:hypothetical protein